MALMFRSPTSHIALYISDHVTDLLHQPSCTRAAADTDFWSGEDLESEETPQPTLNLKQQLDNEQTQKQQ